MKSKAMKWLGTLLGCLSLIAVVGVLAGPVNDKCPLSGRAIDPKKTYTVAFCCTNCSGKFKKEPAKNIAKVKS